MPRTMSEERELMVRARFGSAIPPQPHEVGGAPAACRELFAELDAERSAHEDTRRERDAATDALANKIGDVHFADLAAAQARIAELECRLREMVYVVRNQSCAHPFGAPCAVCDAKTSLSSSSPKDALRSVCEKVAREMDRVTSKDIEDDWPGTTDQRIDEVVSSILGPEVKPC